MRKIQIGYSPLSKNLNHPADRRRFVFFAKEKNINFEIANINKKYDYVIITGLSDFTLWKNYTKGKIIFELLDPYLFDKNLKIKNILRSLGKFLIGQFKKININYIELLKEMCKISHCVICASETHRKTLTKYNKNIYVIPDYHGEFENLNYDFTKKNIINNDINIMWEGYPANLYSKEFVKIFKYLKHNNNITLNIITDLNYNFFLNKFWNKKTENILLKNNINYKIYKWNIKNVINIALKSNFAIIPLSKNNLFEFNKPENKLLLMWRLGLPTITSNTPAYTKLMHRNKNENLLVTNNNWDEKIQFLIKNKKLVSEYSLKNRKFIEENYNKEKILSLWENIFDNSS